MDACLQTYAQKLDFLARRLISSLQQLENHTKQLKQLPIAINYKLANKCVFSYIWVKLEQKL
jgi:hypothetical protein